MSTRSAIVAKIGNKYHGVYCHAMSFSTLKKHYSTHEKVEQLIALGELSSLEKNIAPKEGVPHSFEYPAPNVTVAYYRDSNERQEEDNGPEVHIGDSIADVVANIDHENLYIFENDCWRSVIPYDPLEDHAEVFDIMIDRLGEASEISQEQLRKVYLKSVEKVKKNCIKKSQLNGVEYVLDEVKAEEQFNSAVNYIKKEKEKKEAKAKEFKHPPEIANKISNLFIHKMKQYDREFDMSTLTIEKRSEMWNDCEKEVLAEIA